MHFCKDIINRMSIRNIDTSLTRSCNLRAIHNCACVLVGLASVACQGIAILKIPSDVFGNIKLRYSQEFVPVCWWSGQLEELWTCCWFYCSWRRPLQYVPSCSRKPEQSSGHIGLSVFGFELALGPRAPENLKGVLGTLASVCFGFRWL